MNKRRRLFPWRWRILPFAVALVLVSSTMASASQTTSTSSSATAASTGIAPEVGTVTDPDRSASDDHDLLDADGDNDESVSGLAVSTASLPEAMAGKLYAATLVATGGVQGAGTTWSSPDLPSWLTLSSSGALSGTAPATTAAVTDTFTVAVTSTVQPVDQDDSGPEQAPENAGMESLETAPAPASATAQATLSVTIVPAITISPGPLPDAHLGVPYAYMIGASGGSANPALTHLSWSVVSASFTVSTSGGSQTSTPSSPNVAPGLSLAPDGVLSGTPSASGEATFTVRATNPSLPTYAQTQTLTLSVLPTSLQVLTDVLPDATVGESYSQDLQTNGGGTPPYSWSVATGGLPAGLQLSSGGQIQGTPTTASVASFTVEVTDNGTTTSGAVYEPQQQTASVLLALVVEPTSGITISQTVLPSGLVGQAYGPVTFRASGGSGSYTWSVGGSTPLPTGLTLSSTGVLSGTPSAQFSGSITIEVSDGTNTASASFPLQIGVSGPAITTKSLPDATVGSAYNVTLTATGGVTPLTWSVPSAAAVACSSATGSQSKYLPCGLSLSSGGVLSGTPASGTGGTYQISVQVTDGNNASQAITLALTIKTATALTITTTSPLTNAEETVPYSAILQASGGNGSSTYNWILGSHSALPNGLQLQPYNCSSCGEGVISGTPVAGTATGGPSANGQYQFTVQVTDNANNQASQTFDLKVIPAPKITTTSVSNGEVNASYSATLDSTGGAGGNTWSVSSGSLPAGLKLTGNGASATISGKPTAEVTDQSFTIQLKDKNGAVVTHTYAMTIFPALSVSQSPATAPIGEVGVAYTGLSFPATGGQGASSYSWSATGLPSGLSINASTGAVSGTPTATASPASVTVTVTDGIGTVQTTASLTVDSAVGGISLSPTSGSPGSAYTGTLSATGGSGTYTWSAANLPTWLTLSGNKLTGTMPSSATATTTYTFSVTATDTLGGQATVSLTISG